MRSGIQATAVLGAGSWGTALALLLAERGEGVWLWDRDAEQVRELHEKRENRRYLPGFPLPDNLYPNADLDEVIAGRPCVVLAVPTVAVRSLITRLLPYLSPQALLILAAKGMEAETGLLPAEVGQAVCAMGRFVALSGPNLATEVARGIPAAAVAAGFSGSDAEEVAYLFSRPTYRVYTSVDILGVEMGGAIKNVLAIAAGVSDGLGYGDNTKATLLTRGLAEMARLGEACGARRETFYGLSGVGDLMATSASRLSRNWRVGEALARGERLSDILLRLGQVAEGVSTASAVVRRAEAMGVEMPVCATVNALLRGQLLPREAVSHLMSRSPGAE